jgi:hypothetical protein
VSVEGNELSTRDTVLGVATERLAVTVDCFGARERGLFEVVLCSTLAAVNTQAIGPPSGRSRITRRQPCSTPLYSPTAVLSNAAG